MSRFKEIQNKHSAMDHHIARRLKERREALGITQKELAIAVDVSIPQMRKYEQGINRIASSLIPPLSNILKVPIGYFFCLEGTTYEESGEKCHFASDHSATEIAINKDLVFLERLLRAIEDSALRKKFLHLVKGMVDCITAARTNEH